MLAIRPLARLLRRAASKLIGESGARVAVDPTQWHTYRLDWRAEQARFFVDGSEVYASPVSPHGPLGLVLWIDNQYAAFPPSGKLAMGTSANPEAAWLEMEGIEVAAE
jgi:hypothetical protein